jgi:hypothetical protein
VARVETHVEQTASTWFAPARDRDRTAAVVSKPYDDARRIPLLGGIRARNLPRFLAEPDSFVGAHRVALAVPADWKTEVQKWAYCPPTDPNRVEFFVPFHGPVGSCPVPDGPSWPAEDSVSIYTSSSDGVRIPHNAASGRVHGTPYYVSDSNQSGAGLPDLDRAGSWRRAPRRG